MTPPTGPDSAQSLVTTPGFDFFPAPEVQTRPRLRPEEPILIPGPDLAYRVPPPPRI